MWNHISSSIPYSHACSCMHGYPYFRPSIWMQLCNYCSKCRILHALLATNLPFLLCDKLGMLLLRQDRTRMNGILVYTNYNWSHYRSRIRKICFSAKDSDAYTRTRIRTDSCTMGKHPWTSTQGLLRMGFCTKLGLLMCSSFEAQLAMSYQRSMLFWHSQMEQSTSKLDQMQRHHMQMVYKSYYQRILVETKYHHRNITMQRAWQRYHHLLQRVPKIISS